MAYGLGDVIPARDSGTNALVSITIGKAHLIRLIFAYGSTPTGGRVTVRDGASTILTFPVTAGGPGPVRLAIRGDNLVAELAAGGSGVTGDLYVEYVR